MQFILDTEVRPRLFGTQSRHGTGLKSLQLSARALACSLTSCKVRSQLSSDNVPSTSSPHSQFMKTCLYIVQHEDVIRYAAYETRAKQATPFSIAASYNGPDLRLNVKIMHEKCKMGGK